MSLVILELWHLIFIDRERTIPVLREAGAETDPERFRAAERTALELISTMVDEVSSVAEDWLAAPSLISSAEAEICSAALIKCSELPWRLAMTSFRLASILWKACPKLSRLDRGSILTERLPPAMASAALAISRR